LPTTHATHSVESAEPVEGDAVPGAQLVQLEAPDDAW
jgi:hypothetical protein